MQVNVGGTYFEVPEHYTDLKSIGSGGYGAVWYVKELGCAITRRLLIFAPPIPFKVCHALFLSGHSSATDTRTNKRVAIKKQMKAFETPIHAKRTYREIKLLSDIKHDNVCSEWKRGPGFMSLAR
jgi:serine/threonine protein kinase